ncbi:AQG_2a_G0050480.mRNA.1.CDS.1 [Saccharomyces cerevisiae]|uniref:YOR087Wp-like protein n=4 Tax=Saccharomyces cerevisiae TaxID=4932 RepID=B5VRY3_YEAS6|nr:Yvc1p [Saccharomyces cerevisiae YJM244]AJT72986.1 Yvc1p [Saccharomyces cerevisiae YJM248]AJT76908.1 Yvc1p [Saccharomyces cerevisiae YJM453]AJT77400.1 Yvc1p [Saccharomyces cerevisiae YJM456]AJT78370.1 Yvc1p [Saccharomyces cerevisiae YJM541]AJT79360.1 Yvc1p [Saccharomyces cerevisiae YJM555]AJT81822.1 Yvc1p [Saccharomyces cerevisiae YJM689]AJT87701.1 Yvc1p [Saccharomyces cerevisiae YJM1129]AJT88194.1 Yvc1p [Saccharomyces cerevisiae YJM1133]AJT88682.1 Yvc1p [Saccharomyces cerevisiae YJM1190
MVSANGDLHLPISNEQCMPENNGSLGFEAPTPRQVLRVTLNLKYLIDKVVPIVYDPNDIVCDHSEILSPKVVKLAYEACGGNPKDKANKRKYQSVIIFSLLKVCEWYSILATMEVHNAKLYETRNLASQQLCKLLIEREETRDLQFLFMQLLLRRYVINENDEDQEPLNALELATDMHCTTVIGSSGFQRCLKWIWRGWIVQNGLDPTTFIKDDSLAEVSLISHFNPVRLKAPVYQNYLQMIFSFLFLGLYTLVVNGKDSERVQSFDLLESIFYVFNTGFILDELTKLYYIGYAHLSFWNLFNDTTYLIITFAMGFRAMSVTPLNAKYSSEDWDKISYRVLSCAAPFVWSRLLLYLESQRFIGIMLVILKHMMKESIVFFFLLFLIMIGFTQGFLGLDSADGKRDITGPILGNLTITVLGLGSFDVFEEFAPPYAAILYYGYYFIVSVILLNILIALYSTAYQKVIDNADDEYMALMSQKTLRYIRAPDEDVYVSPLNLIEVFMTPIFRILPPKRAKDLSYTVMTIVYSPFLLLISVKETREARRIKYNRMKRLNDDANEYDTPWDLTDGYLDDDDGLFSDNRNSGMRATQLKNSRSLKLQRTAEQEDVHFKVPKKWYKNVKKCSPSFEQYDNDDTEDDVGEDKDEVKELTKKVENLTAVITDLLEKLDIKDKKE